MKYCPVHTKRPPDDGSNVVIRLDAGKAVQLNNYFTSVVWISGQPHFF